MVFTKKGTKQSIARAQEITHEDVLANVQIKISATQGPKDSKEKRMWYIGILEHFTGQGFEARLYYRHANGRVVGGEVHHAIDAASDLLLCPKTFLSLEEPPRPFEGKVNVALAAAMREVLDRDELWEQIT